MIRLRFPVDEPEVAEVCVAEIRTAIQAARDPEARERMLAAFDQIEARIRAYIDARGNPEVLGASPFARSGPNEPSTVGDLLFERYMSGAGSDKAIVSHANRVAGEHCPYCGFRIRLKIGNRSPDRDHIVPRSRWPEFSILRLNLATACDDCNTGKSDLALDAAGSWIFVHPYYDDWLAQTLLEVEATVVNRAPSLAFSVIDLPDPAIRGRLARHFEAMQLNTRYGDEVHGEVVRQLLAHREHLARGTCTIDTVRDILRTIARGELEPRPNDPIGLALAALADAPELELLVT